MDVVVPANDDDVSEALNNINEITENTATYNFTLVICKNKFNFNENICFFFRKNIFVVRELNNNERRRAQQI